METLYKISYSPTIASTYGSGSYNTQTYNNSASTGTGSSTGTTAGSTGTSTSTSQATGQGGVLANTGFAVLLAVSLACLIVFAALIVRFWKRRRPAADNI